MRYAGYLENKAFDNIHNKQRLLKNESLFSRLTNDYKWEISWHRWTTAIQSNLNTLQLNYTILLPALTIWLCIRFSSLL